MLFTKGGLLTEGGLTDIIPFYTIEAATPESLDALRRIFQGETVEDPNIATWSASREDVAENDYNLVPNRYKPYEPPPPGPPLEELWADMELIEEEVARSQAQLRELLTGVVDFEEVERLKEEQRPGGGGTLAQLEAESHKAMDDLRETLDGVVDFEEVERLKEQKR